MRKNSVLHEREGLKMRKLFWLLLALLFLLGGCGNAQADPVSLYDSFLLLEIETKDSVIPAMFNPKSGTMMPLCTDPLCTHGEDSGCAFAGFDQILAAEGGKLYYTVNVAEKKPDGTYLGTAYRVYDLETASLKELCRKTELHTEGRMSSAGSIAGDWHYISQSGNTDYYFRVNYKTGKIEDLSDLEEVILPIYEDENYLYAPAAAGLFGVCTGILRTDHAFQNKEILFDAGEPVGDTDFSMLSEGYIYYYTLNSGSYDLRRCSVKTGDSETVLEEILFSVIGDGKIYYTREAETPAFLYFDAWRDRDVYDTVGGKIYVCDPDGRNSALIYDSSQYIVRDRNMQYKNGCLICDFGKMTEKEYEHGEMRPRLEPNGGGKIVIDVNTGESAAYEKIW